MKNTIKYLSGLLLMGFVASCQPDEFDGANIAGLPEANNYKVVATVDQSINQVVIDLVDANNQPAKGVYPIVTIELPDGKTVEKTTTSGYTNIFVKSGDYKVTAKVGNRNGVSDGELTTIFHMDNSIVDYTKYYTMISKETWYLDNTAKGHLACGETIDNPAGWWAAGPDEKAAFGVYDNALTFTAEGKYTFNPGEAGTVYANKCVTALGVTDATEDYTVEAAEATYEYSFDTEGDDLILILQAKSWFPYIASDQIYETPRYKVVSMTTKAMTLVSYQKTSANPDGIAWQYILSTSHEVKFTGFKYDQENNIWKNSEITAGGMYYADGGWTPYPDVNQDEIFSVTNQETSVNLVKSTAGQWQAQFPILTDIGPKDSRMTSAKKYDFSCVITASKDLESMTLKLVETGENNVPGSLGIAYDANAVFYSPDNKLKAYEDYVFYIVDQQGVDIQDNLLQLVMDFGGCEEGTEVTVKNIVLIEHDLNTELDKLPSEEPSDKPGEGPAVKDWDSASSANLWNAVENGDAFISITPWMTGAENWDGGLNPEWTRENGVYTVVLPEGLGGDQWKGQFPINTTLTATQSKKYNFYCVVEADADAPGVTIKLTETDDAVKHDNNFFFADRHDVKAFEPFIYKAEGVQLAQNDAHALSLFFDFGGTPGGTTVKISEIYFEEVVVLDYNDENNLWKAVDAGDALVSVTPWMTGAANWDGGLNPEWKQEGNVWTVILPEGLGGDQWKGQFPINTTLTAAQADSYNFSCTIEADNDAPGVTIKLTETDDATKHDNNFFFADRHDVKAFEPFVYTVKGVKLAQNDAHALSLFFDFGGTPGGTEVKISNIILEKAN